MTSMWTSFNHMMRSTSWSWSHHRDKLMYRTLHNKIEIVVYLISCSMPPLLLQASGSSNPEWNCMLLSQREKTIREIQCLTPRMKTNTKKRITFLPPNSTSWLWHTACFLMQTRPCALPVRQEQGLLNMDTFVVECGAPTRGGLWRWRLYER